MPLDWLTFMQDNGWLIAIAALAVSLWNAWTSWRRDRSRFRVTVSRPPSYRPAEGVVVTAVYNGGPPIKIIAARARVVRIDRIRWFEVAPQDPQSATLRPEAREVAIKIDATYVDHFWYVEILAEGGVRKRRYLRRFPPIWLKKLLLGTATMADVGARPHPGRLEKSIKKLRRELHKEAKAKGHNVDI